MLLETPISRDTLNLTQGDLQSLSIRAALTGKERKEHTPDERTTDAIYIFSDHNLWDRCLTFLFVVTLSAKAYKERNLLRYFRSDKRLSHHIRPHSHDARTSNMCLNPLDNMQERLQERVAGVVEKLGTAPDDVFAQVDMLTSIIYLRLKGITVRKNGSDRETLIGNADLESPLKLVRANAIASTMSIVLCISYVFW